jgi:hypothetical protein
VAAKHVAAGKVAIAAVKAKEMRDGERAIIGAKTGIEGVDRTEIGHNVRNQNREWRPKAGR